jgi:hypothetical protein
MRVPQHCFALSGLASERTDSRTQAAGLGFASAPLWGLTNALHRYSIGHLGMAASISAIRRMVSLKAVTTLQ